MFKRFDKNGDGRLGEDELGALMAHVGGDAGIMLAELDEDKSGTIEQVDGARSPITTLVSCLCSCQVCDS